MTQPIGGYGSGIAGRWHAAEETAGAASALGDRSHGSGVARGSDPLHFVTPPAAPSGQLGAAGAHPGEPEPVQPTGLLWSIGVAIRTALGQVLGR